MEAEVLLDEPFVEDAAVVGVQGVSGHTGRGGQGIGVIPGVKVEGETDLAQMAEAFCAVG